MHIFQILNTYAFVQVYDMTDNEHHNIDQHSYYEYSINKKIKTINE